MAWNTLDFIERYAKSRTIVYRQYMQDHSKSFLELTNEDCAKIDLRILSRSVTPEDTRYLNSVGYTGQWGYLSSNYWAILLEAVRVIRKNECDLCKRRDFNTEVHHLTYRHRGCEFDHLDDLQLFCSTCHKKVHNRSLYR